jgi:hypothetical protein
MNICEGHEIYSVSVKGKKMEYDVCYEKDMKDPLDLFLIDYEGKGIFTKFDTTTMLRFRIGQ